MATVENSSSSSGELPLISPGPAATRLLTAADIAVLPEVLPSGLVKYELYSGRLAIMSPPGYRHGAVQLRIGSALLVQGEAHGLGRAFTEVGVVVGRNPDTILGPDVCFVGAARLPLKESAEGYLETIPDIVVEVRSKNDSHAELSQKAEL